MIGQRAAPEDLSRPSGPTPAEQTRRSWAQRIRSYDSLPAAFKGFFDARDPSGRVFPYCVLTPAYEGFLHRTTEKLAFVIGQELFVLERRGASFSERSFVLADISHTTVSTVLLDSRISISGLTQQGVADVASLRFSSVTDYLLAPIVERIRLVGADPTGWPLTAESERFDEWKDVNYKFMNYAKRSLLGHERVYHAILQPRIPRFEFRLLAKTFYRWLSPVHATILTDRELILILEGRKRIEGENYGGTWHFVPLARLADMSITEKDGRLLTLNVHPAHVAPIQCIFQMSAEQDLARMLDQFREWRSR